MKFISNLFRKKKTLKQDVYAYMGSLGISPEYMKMYQDSVKKIKEFEKKMDN